MSSIPYPSPIWVTVAYGVLISTSAVCGIVVAVWLLKKRNVTLAASLLRGFGVFGLILLGGCAWGLIPVAYYNDPGDRDAYYAPVIYPYQLVAGDGLDCGLIKNAISNTDLITGVLELAHASRIVFGRRRDSCTNAANDSWFAVVVYYGFTEQHSMTSLEEFHQTLRKLGVNSKMELQTIKDYYNTYWGHFEDQ